MRKRKKNKNYIKINELVFFYDTFTHEVVLEKDDFSPPERYFAIGMTNLDDMYEDTWFNYDKSRSLVFAYSKLDIENFGWDKTIKLHLEENDFNSRSKLVIRRYPKKEFLEIISDYFNVDFENEEIEVDF